MKFSKVQVEIRVAILYAIFGGLWILFSDSLLVNIAPDYAFYTRLQTFKGWFFVAASAGLIAYLIKRETSKGFETAQKLLESEETLRRYELLSENSRDIILFMRQDDGRILEANAAATQAYGYSRDKLLELSIPDLRASGTQNLTADQMTQADSGGILFETVHLRKDGSTFPVEVSSQGATIGNTRTLVSIVRDITTRNRAEAEIASLSKFPTENPDPVLRVQPDGQISYANEASRELLKMWDCEINDFLPEEWRELINETTKSGSQKAVDVPCNGMIYSVMVVPVSDGGYVNLYGRDITARLRAEQALSESEEKYRLIADNADDWIYWIKPDRSFRYVSPSCKHITGFAPLDFMANPRLFTEIVHPEDRARFESHSELIKPETELEELEYRIITKKGEVRWINHSCAPVFTDAGEYIGRRGTNRDITERRRAEEALRESEERLRLSLHAARQGLYDLNVQTGAAIVNEEYAEMLGYDPETFVETNAAWIERLHPNDKAVTQKAYQDYINGALPEYRVEFRQKTKGGNWKWILSLGKVVEYDPLGKPLRMLGTHTDITERKQAEEELNRTLEELKSSNAELEQFAYVASHDLQEPLRGIAGLAQLLQQRYQGQLDSQADEFINLIVDGTQRMQTLINDLLAYSRIGRRGETIRSTGAEAALKAVMQNLSVAIREYGTTITNESLPTVKADATQLIQLFQNLIGNAIKFRTERPPQIHIGVTDVGDFWQFSVCDNGIGIEPQYFERIFQVFQRLHTRREYKGTGIGLAICKKIIERHGGRIWVESQKGQGSTFYFTLPKGN